MDFMQEAIRQAQIARKHGEVPIGCVIVKDGKIIGGLLLRKFITPVKTGQKSLFLTLSHELWKKSKSSAIVVPRLKLVCTK